MIDRSIKKIDDDYIEGVLLLVDQPNINGIIYPREIFHNFESCIGTMVTFQNQTAQKIQLQNVVGKVEEIRIEGGALIGKIKLLQTPSRKLLEQLIAERNVFGFSVSGFGTVKENKVVDYKISTIDFEKVENLT